MTEITSKDALFIHGYMGPGQTPYEEAIALLVCLQKYTEGKYENAAVYTEVLKPWLDDFLIRSL